MTRPIVNVGRSRSRRKPHSGDAGYVCERKCALGGHVVIYDRERGADDIDADERWIVMHQPSTLHVAVRSERQARDIMVGVATATSLHDAACFADILPTRENMPDGAPVIRETMRCGGADVESTLRRIA